MMAKHEFAVGAGSLRPCLGATMLGPGGRGEPAPTPVFLHDAHMGIPHPNSCFTLLRQLAPRA